jgi:hypothetical protein
VGIFKRLFGSASPAAEGSESKQSAYAALDLAGKILMIQFDLGGALPGGSNRHRLEKPYARGYMFGFIDACLQRAGVIDDSEALSLIIVAHAKLLGVETGSSYVRKAMSDQTADSIFGKGRAAGGADLFRWLANTNEPSSTPLLLADFLSGNDVPPEAE